MLSTQYVSLLLLSNMSGHKGADKYASNLNNIKVVLIIVFWVRVVKCNKETEKKENRSAAFQKVLGPLTSFSRAVENGKTRFALTIQ